MMSGGADPRSPDTVRGVLPACLDDAVRWATALTGSIAAGEDLAQDAFARVRSRFASIDNADGYLRATIVNLARDQRRAKHRRASRELRVVGDMTAAANRGSRTTPVDGARPPALRAAGTLVLRYWADWDEATIAAALGCRSSTVRSHAKRGLGRAQKVSRCNRNEHGDRTMKMTDDELIRQMRAELDERPPKCVACPVTHPSHIRATPLRAPPTTAAGWRLASPPRPWPRSSAD